MRLAFKLFILAAVVVFIILRRLNVLAKVRIEKQTQGPYTIMYKEYVGIPFRKAYKSAIDDFKRLKVNNFPVVIVNFNDTKQTSVSKRKYWIGVAIHLETAEEFPKLFKEYERDFIYKDVYQSCNIPCKNLITELLLPKRVYPMLRKYTKSCSMEVIERTNGLVRFIADPIIKSINE